MRSIIKRCYEDFGHVRHISTKPETIRGLLEATTTETVKFRHPNKGLFVAICDIDARKKHKPFNCSIHGIAFFGDVIILGINSRGELTNCPLLMNEWKALL